MKVATVLRDTLYYRHLYQRELVIRVVLTTKTIQNLLHTKKDPTMNTKKYRQGIGVKRSIDEKRQMHTVVFFL